MTNHQAARLVAGTLAQLSQAVLQYRARINNELDKKEYELPKEDSDNSISFNLNLREMVKRFHELEEESK